MGKSDTQEWRAEYRDKNREKIRQQSRESARRRYAANKAEYDKKRRERTLHLQQIAEGIKASRGCSRCSEKHPACLDFHHRDQKEKKLSVAMICKRAQSVENLMAEIDKCDVLCSNCHRKEHWSERTGIKIDKCVVNVDAAANALREIEGVVARYRKALA